MRSSQSPTPQGRQPTSRRDNTTANDITPDSPAQGTSLGRRAPIISGFGNRRGLHPGELGGCGKPRLYS